MIILKREEPSTFQPHVPPLLICGLAHNLFKGENSSCLVAAYPSETGHVGKQLKSITAMGIVKEIVRPPHHLLNQLDPKWQLVLPLSSLYAHCNTLAY